MEQTVIALEWTAINWQEKTITISAELAKTRRKRIIEMPENLLSWLHPFVFQKGDIAPPNYRERLEKLRKEI